MKYTLKIIVFFFMVSSIFSYAQKKDLRKAAKKYDGFAYVKTSEILLAVAQSGHTSVDLLKKLGNSFYYNNQMKEASKWYGELMAMEAELDREYYFKYAQTLKSTENYEESDKWMQKFYESNRSDLRGKAFASSIDYLSMIDEYGRDFEVHNMALNSEFSDFGAMRNGDQFIFASSRGSGKIYNWNEQPFLNLYTATKQEDGSFDQVTSFGDDINSPYHESSVSYSPDGNTMYFTRNNYYKKKSKKGKDGVYHLKIYSAKKQPDGSWSEIASLPFNNNNYNVAHPAVNATGTKLYFASDMPGTLGDSDIFVVDLHKDGSFGDPINLGTSVNTEATESFPYVNSVGDLYFSSNGFTGLGGLDVYEIKDYETRSAAHQILILKNIGRPINSPQDDFGYYENIKTKEGFFASNRDGGKGDDDIYSFTIPQCTQLVSGFIKDKDSNKMIANSKVTLFDGAGRKLQGRVTGVDGSYEFTVACAKEYLVRIEKQGYIGAEKRFTTPQKKQELKIDLLLEKDTKIIKQGVDLAKVLDIPMIHFDFDKSNIKDDAALELQKVIAVLKKYPTMKIDVKSHTDSRGTATYNKSLSSRRNKATIDYIINVGGISANRLTGNGYGEELLVNNCSDGVSCTETEHQQNRRSEFIVLRLK